MAGLVVPAVFAFVSLILSYGLFVPKDLQMFSLLAVVGSMAGYALGELAAKNVVNSKLRAIFIVIDAALCVGFVIVYAVRIEGVHANVSDIVALALLLTGIFLTFTFLMPLAGVRFERKPANPS
jgi:hypothetical protein